MPRSRAAVTPPRRPPTAGRGPRREAAKPDAASLSPELAESAERKARIEAWLRQPVAFLASRLA